MWTGPVAPACPCTATASSIRRRHPCSLGRFGGADPAHRCLRHPVVPAASPSAAVAAPGAPSARRAALDAHFAARVASHDSASTSQSWAAPPAPPRQQQRQQQQQQQRQQSAGGSDPLLLPSRMLPRKQGAWCLRQFEPEDLQQIVDLQATAFHEPLGLGLFAVLDVLARSSFDAEVLDAMKKKVAALQPSAFAMLVLEERGPSGSSVVGVVEVGVQDQGEVLRWLPRNTSGAKPDCYAHIASMAVSKARRRQGIASLLLQAAEQQAALWGQKMVALHVHADNEVAVQLYTRCGMQVLHSDPAWRTLVGGRVRLLMAKPVGVGARSR